MFEIKQGIAIFDCPDYYASLGLAIGTSKGDIRKRYFKVARSLHPDSCPPEMDKAQASQILSKLVNPAYEALSQDKELEEYKVLLRLVGQRAIREVNPAAIKADSAQALLVASEFETVYQEQIQHLAQHQFDTLEQVMTIVCQLSELNLAYLIRTEQAKQTGTATPNRVMQAQASPPTKPETQVSSVSQAPPPPANQAAPTSQFVNDYCRRAEELISKNRLNDAIVELRDALKLEAQNSRCHSLMGSIYLKKSSLKMAKVHFTQALKSNPQDIEALKGMTKVEKLEKRLNPKPSGTPATPQRPARKGLFGLFGGKK